MNIFKRTNAKREADAGLTPKEAPNEAPKEAPKDKPKRTMTQAEFSGYAKGGMTKTGSDSSRDSKGWEYKDSGDMAPDSAKIRREQAGQIERETRHTVKGTKALDASTKMGNPARYAKGGVVKGRGDGCAVKGKTKGRMV